MKILRWLADLRIGAVVLLFLALETLIGTLLQAKMGLYATQQMFFHNWIAILPIGGGYSIPLPGVPILGLMAILNLSAVLIFKIQWKLRNFGLILLHLGLMALLLSAGLSWWSSTTAFVELSPGQVVYQAESEHEWELVYLEENGKGNAIWMVDFQLLNEGESLHIGAPKLQSFQIVEKSSHGILLGENRKLQHLPIMGEPSQWTPVVKVKINNQIHGVSSRGQSVVLAPGSLLFLRKKRMDLPVSFQLIKFIHETHPGSEMASKYESIVTIKEENGSSREVRISMNEPLRIGEYTVFQSSWRQGSAGEKQSILSVTRNPWRTLPYWSTLLIALGLFWHTARQIGHAMQQRKTVATMLIALLGLGVSPIDAREVPPSLMKLPILVDGRAKPFEAYARHLKLQVSGTSRSASSWFVGALFGDSTSDSQEVFLIENPDVRNALGLSGHARDRYSWKVLVNIGFRLDSLARSALLVQERQRTAMQRDLLRVADSWNRYYAVRHAFDFLQTDSVFHANPPRWSGLKNFLDFTKQAPHVRPRLDSLMKMAGDSLDASAKQELDWVHGVLQSAHAWTPVDFPVVPVLDSGKIVFRSPGAELMLRGPDAQLLTILGYWEKIRQHWLANEIHLTEPYADSLWMMQLQISQGSKFRNQALCVEAWYYRLDVFYHALLLLFFALILAGLAYWKHWKKLDTIAFVLLSAGWLLVLLGIALRMYITLRPPATNLYDTFVFSAAVAMPLAWWVGYWRRISLNTALAALVGAILLFLARRHGLNGDTMPVLAAVLDSNFWLTLHVLSITAGYAGVVVAGGYAHWHLWMWKITKDSAQELSAYKALRLLMMIGLFFTFVGTLLGAIWADQSWGRFWGWDPKENGALIIILWVSFLFHAVPCGWLGRRGFSIGSVFAIQTVLFAWFGVNLMGVGLHSYGFTQGTFYGLVGFALLELGYVLWILFRK